MNTLTLICGLPNAGKTTYSKQFENVLHFDDYREMGWGGRPKFKEDVLEGLKNGDIYVEGSYPTAKLRYSNLLSFIEDIECKKVCVVINTPLETCLERVPNGRSEAIVKHVAAIFEQPTKEEGWDEIITINN